MYIDNKKMECFLCKKQYSWSSPRIEIALSCHLKCAVLEKQIEDAQQKLTELEYKTFQICHKCTVLDKQIEKAQQKLTDLEYKKFLICQK
tara:strand:+ start:4299 stop:4568 length:270 start_codon:yes stop_codon:yes gene_type:complete